MATLTAARVDAPLAALAGLCAAALTGVVLAVDGAVMAVPVHNDSTPVVAAVLAVVAVAGLQHSGSRRTGWMIATGCVLVLGTVRYIAPSDADTDTQSALQIVVAATAGILLGAAIAATWGRASGQWAVIAGAWSAFLAAAATGTERPFDSLHWTVPQWLLAITLVTVVAAALVAQPGMRVQRADPRLWPVAVGAALALSVGYRVLGDRVTAESASSTVRMWLFVGGALLLLVIGAEVTARFLPPGDGPFPMAVTGATVTAYPLVAALGGPEVPGWTPAVAVVAVLAGLRAAPRMPRPELGLALALVTTAVAALWPDLAADGWPLLVRVALIAAGTGLALGSALPGSAPVAALGAALPFAALPVLGAVWSIAADPMLVVGALVVAGAVCAWQVR
ncbi:hypothetical protein [Rhodococcus zopfii]|uniref:hypothetical protein n=1 Tax=Rhodococcus zopfii TaxID=43772 RepID=UPI0011116111|nr:hypothetical protein [Rhodococcus zopfii]